MQRTHVRLQSYNLPTAAVLNVTTCALLCYFYMWAVTGPASYCTEVKRRTGKSFAAGLPLGADSDLLAAWTTAGGPRCQDHVL